MVLSKSDKRTPFLDLLRRYLPVDETDRIQRDRILQFVESIPDCFDRSHLTGHITGSAWVVDKTGSRVLLTHHKKLNKWLQLGGHADGNPNVVEAALREAQEESGLNDLRLISDEIFDLDIHPIPERNHEPAHIHYDIRFLIQTVGSEKFTVSDESNELRWVGIDEVASLSNEPSLIRMVEKYKKFKVASERSGEN